MAGADSPNVNTYASATQDITTHGSAWLWAVFALMASSALVVFVWHLTIPRGQRLFHQIGLVILVTASIAYFAMASALGRTPVPIEFSHANGFPLGTTRSIWYVRYIDWVITTPALLLELLLASALPLSDIFSVIFFDLVMIITGLVGALVPSSYKWGFYTFGCVAEFYIWWVLFGPARRSAGLLGGNFGRSFTSSAAILSFLWLLYPVAWGLADGGNVITADSEMVFYGVLDVLAKPVFLFIHLFQLSREDLTALQLSSGKFSETGVARAPDHESRFGNVGPATTARPVSGINEKKAGLFSRRGKYDANGHNATAGNPIIAVDNPPRTSQATVVSH